MSSRNLWFSVAIILLTAVNAPPVKKKTAPVEVHWTRELFNAYKNKLTALGLGKIEFLSHKAQTDAEAKSLVDARANFEKEYVKAAGRGKNAVLSGDYMLFYVGTASTEGFAVHNKKTNPVSPLYIPNAVTFGTANANSDDDVANFLKHVFDKAADISIVFIGAIGFAVPKIRSKAAVTNEPLLQIGGDGAETIAATFKVKERTAAKLVYQISMAAKKYPERQLFVKAREVPKVDISWPKQLAKALPARGAIKWICEVSGSLSRKIVASKDGAFTIGSFKAGDGKDLSQTVNALYKASPKTPAAAEALAQTVFDQLKGAFDEVEGTVNPKEVAVYQTGLMRVEEAKLPSPKERYIAAIAKKEKHTVKRRKKVGKSVKTGYLEKIKKEKEAKAQKVAEEKKKRIEKEVKGVIHTARQADFNEYDDDAYTYDDDDAYEWDDFYYDAYGYNDDDDDAYKYDEYVDYESDNAAYEFDDDAYNNEEYGSYQLDDDNKVSHGYVNGYRYYAEPRAEVPQSGYYMDDNIKFAEVLFSAFALMVCCVVSFVCGVCGVIFGFKMQKKRMEKAAAYSNVNVSESEI